MRSLTHFGVLLLVLCCLTGIAFSRHDAILGEWACEVYVDSNGQTYPFMLTLSEQDETLSGTASSDMGTVQLEQVKFSEDNLTFQIHLAESGNINFDLKITGSSLSGRCGNYDFEGTVKGQKK